MIVRNKDNKGFHRIKLMLICVLITLVLTFGNSLQTYALAPPPEPSCKGALLVDNKTGHVLYEKNSNVQLTPASLTKIMTCMLILEKLDGKKEITITKEATGFTGNQMALVEGEVLTVDQLLNAMMVYSANDASVALAIAASGSEEAFVAEMNQRAKDLGATHTNFLNCNGLTESLEHTTTAADMYIITREALKNDKFRSLVGQKECVIAPTNKSPERKLQSTNKLLYDQETKIQVAGKERTPEYKGAFGIKTGMMLSSGWCLIAGAKQGDTELVTIVLNSPDEMDRFSDSILLLDYGFANFHTYQAMAPGTSCGKVKVKYGSSTKVDTTVPDGAYMTLPKEAMESVAKTKIVLSDQIKAPIKKGTKVGVVELYESDHKVGEVDITINKSVNKGGPWTALYIPDSLAYTVIAIIILGGATFIFLVKRKKRILKKREEQRRKERAAKARAIALEREERKRREWPY